MTIETRLFDAARSGALPELQALLDQHPEAVSATAPPYEHTLLHVAARHGHLAIVDLLLGRGLDANVREKGDNTYPMHWAAAGGHLDVVQRLADAGGDVVGHGDDHDLEVIGWATCWNGADDARHRAVAEFLVSRGASHHIFSAIALGLVDEVRRIVAADGSALGKRQSRNEDFRLPLHFAVLQNRTEVVDLLLELGADPLATDGSGHSAAAYATTPEMGRRFPLRIAKERDGALHLMAKRGDVAEVKSLLQRGADPNARWAHWDSEVTPLHLAVLAGHAEVVRLLLDAGADSAIRDTKHDGDAIGWAEHFGRVEIGRMLASPSS